MEDKKILLTASEKHIIWQIKNTPGGFLRPYMQLNGLKAYRLLDDKFNPITYFPDKQVTDLIEKGFLYKSENKVFLK